MPFVQCTGLVDGVGFNRKGAFPLTSTEDNTWHATITYWFKYNHIDADFEFTDEYESGIKAHNSEYFQERFLDQSWKDEDGETMYHFITIKRMPHAVDLREIRYGWNIIKHYLRNSDGSLSKE